MNMISFEKPEYKIAKYKKEGKNMEGMTKSKNITESEVSKKYGDEYTEDTSP